MVLTKPDSIVPTVPGDEDAADEPDPEPVADDDPPGAAAVADDLSGDEPPGLDEDVVTEEPAETIDDGEAEAGETSSSVW